MIERRKLRERLRRLREAAGFTQREVSEELEWSLSKVIRIETGSVGISITDLKALLQHYGVTDAAQVNETTAMARVARERPWWEPYKKDAPRGFLLSLGYEATALRIRTFEPSLIPGLLQTEEYAAASLELMSPPETVNARAELRLKRQERVFHEDGPELHFIIDESAITRIVGSVSVMRRQLEHLLDMTQNDQVTLRVVPFRAGLYPHFRTPYVIFEFKDPQDGTVLYLESTEDGADSIVREGPEWDTNQSPDHYLENFFALEQTAKKEEAADIITATLGRISPQRPGINVRPVIPSESAVVAFSGQDGEAPTVTAAEAD